MISSQKMRKKGFGDGKRGSARRFSYIFSGPYLPNFLSGLEFAASKIDSHALILYKRNLLCHSD
jgi:hypothetical protein